MSVDSDPRRSSVPNGSGDISTVALITGSLCHTQGKSLSYESIGGTWSLPQRCLVNIKSYQFRDLSVKGSFRKLTANPI